MAEESQPLGSKVPLMSEEFEASKPLGTRTVSSHSLVLSDSTAPLLPDHPLTRVLPTPTPTQVLFHRRTARIAVRTQPTLSPGMSAQIAESVALSLSSFRKRDEGQGSKETRSWYGGGGGWAHPRVSSMNSIVDTAKSEPLGLDTVRLGVMAFSLSQIGGDKHLVL
ncbi:hypothetical protein Tco_0484679 [Tanacetum coccineum]